MNKHSASVVGPDPDGKYWITLEAGEIRASISVRSSGIVGQVMAAFAGQPALVQPPAVAPASIPAADDDLLASLERAIERAEHQPGQWAETRMSMGGVCSKQDGLRLDEDRWGSFSHKRDAWLAVAAVNALPELMERVRGAERGERAADQEVERLQGELEGVGRQRNGQAEAWIAVFNTLCQVIPGWVDRDQSLTTTEMACNAIRKLAADLDSWKRSERAQVEKIQLMQEEARELREKIEKLQGELRAACQLADQLKDRLEIDPRHPYDGITCRDETIKGLQEQLDVLREAMTSPSIRDVMVERFRQITAEGWTPEHDDDHDSGDLAKAAAAYAMASVSQTQGYNVNRPPLLWPWDKAWWKPCDARRALVKSGALIIAEIERLDRAEATDAIQGSVSLDQVLKAAAPAELVSAMSSQQQAADEQACRQAYDNTYHKIRPDMLYGEWRELWARGEIPHQLHRSSVEGRDATQG